GLLIKLMERLFLFFLVCLSINMQSQTNLIIDPSFEEYSRCPANITQSHRSFILKFWNIPTRGTPDYYNKCSNKVTSSVPYNKMGYQEVRTGTGYIGITCWVNFSEYI